MIKKLFVLLCFLVFAHASSWGQFIGLVLNEFSQGTSGNKEYIELLVAGTKTCTDSTADLRGWIFDDQNQWYGSASNAPGHYRFKSAAVWQAVPYGSIIVIYNVGDKNLSLPPDIIDPANYTYIVPINGSNLFEQNIISPSPITGTTYVYPAASVTTNYMATNNQWPFIFALNNSSTGPSPTPGDVISLISPADRANAFFSLGYDFPIVAGYRAPSVSIPIVPGGYCAYLTTSNYTSAASWTIATVLAGETPGQPNGGANTAWINGMRVPAPALPAAPSLSLVQPTCAVATGTITILSPIGTGFTYSINGTTYTSSTSFTGLASNTYNVTVKNSSGCVSAITSAIISAPPAAPVSPTITLTQPTCIVSTGTITITSPMGTGYTYSIDGTTYTNTTGTFTGLVPNTYNVTVKNSSGCVSAITSVIISVPPASPAAPNITVIQPTCIVSTGTITITSPTGTGYTYSIDGTTYTNTTGTFTGLVPNTYNVTVKNSSGCVSPSTQIIINAQPPTPTTPVVTTTQPTCTVATGIITVTSPTGAGLTYSIDGVNYSNTSGIFNNVSPNTYSVTVKNSSGCASTAIPVVINAQPATPPIPIATVTQPTCFVSTGTIFITSPTGYIYSIDGTNYQTGRTFSALPAGTTYTVYVQNNGCISTATFTINAAPVYAAGSQPVITLTQPTCTTLAGSILVTAPVGNGYSYSIDAGNTFQSSPIFNALAPGNYNIVFKNSDGCISQANSIVINAVPPAPTAPIVTITQPTCTIATGTITVTSPTSAGLSYSIDGTTYTNTTGIFTGLVPNTYNVTVKNGSGCVSASTQVIIIAQPPTPATSVVTATQPTCTVATGTIMVTSPTGAGFTYSIDGTTYTNATGIFTALAPNTYNVTVKNGSGCVSASTPVTINSQPATPTAPVAAATQPTCTVATGTIMVTSPTGAGLTYSIDGTTYANTTGIFNGLVPNTYNVTVKNSSGCISALTSIVINAQPSTPGSPVVTATQPTCTVATGTITVTSPTGAGFTYSIDGTTYTNTTGIFTGLSPNTYNVTVKNSSGCVSNSTQVIINAQPLAPSAPTATSPQSFCSSVNPTISDLVASGSNLQWYIALTNGTPLASTTPLVNSTTYYLSQTVAGCESGRTAVTVVITPSAVPSVSITPTTVTSCNGSPVTFTASPVNGGTSASYQWKVNGTNVTGATGSTFTSSTLNNNDVVSVVLTSNASCATTPTATSNAVTVTITLAATPSVSITPTTVTSCSGSQVTFTVSPVNGGTAPTYQWKVNGTNVAGATGSIFTTSTLNNNDLVTVVLTSNASCATTPTATSNSVTVTITSAAAPLVTITPTTVSSCAGSPITFIASPINGGTAPTYQWRVNGINVGGATTSTFTSSTLNNNDVVTVVMTSNAACATTPTATSNPVTVTITSAAAPSVSIAPTTVTSCAGSPVTFITSPVNGGTSPSYQWKVNGTNVAGATGSTFTSSTLSNNDVVTVVLTSNASCATTPTATSNAVTVTITPSAAPSVTITPTTVTSCNGSPVTFTASPVNGGTSPSYQWKVNGTNVAGATGSIFTSSTLNNNDVVNVVLTSNASCPTTPTATSNTVTVIITSAAAPSVSITPTTVTSCAGSPVTFTASPVNGGTSPTYQWKVNGVNVAGTTGSTFTSSTLNNNDVVTVVLTSNVSCATTPTATSNAVIVTITSAAAPSITITPTTVTSCAGSPVTFTASPVNGGTAPTYQWKVNGANVTGATSSTFTTSTLNNNDVVSIVLASNASCATSPTATSNAVTVTITSAAAPSVTITPTAVSSCAGLPVTFTASPVNGVTTPTYQWKVNGTNVTGATGSTFITSILNNNDVVSVVLTSNATCTTTPTATSNTVTVTITSAAAPSVSITPTTVSSCAGSPVTLTASPINSGTSPTYQWKVNGTNVAGATGSTFTISTLNNNDVVSVVLTSNASCATTPTATSNAVTVIITSTAAPVVSITPTTVISCAASPVTFTASPVNGGSAPSYQWKVNGTNVAGATGSTFTSSTLNNNDVVTVVLTSNATCATTPTATSNAVIVAITSAAAPSVTITPTTVISCAGSPVTFTASPVNGGTSPSYQWKVNGTNVTGPTGSTFTTSTLNNNDVVTVVLTSNASCATTPTATSNAVTVTITSAAAPAVSITPTTVTSCAVSPLTFSASPVNGGTAPSYQWKVNGTNVTGATSSTFTSSTLNNNDVVSVVLTSNASCASTPTATSNAVTVTITSAAAPSVTIIPTTVTSCASSPVTFTASPVNGGTSPTYQWKVNGVNVAGATGSTFTSSTLNNNDVVTVVLTSNASCATTPTATSNSVTVTITSAAAPSVSITPTTVTSCAGSPVTFTASPVNGGTTPTYQWKVNGTNVAGATGSTFTSSTLNNNDVVTVALTSNASCATTPTATSNAVTVAITSAAAPSVSATPTTVTSCAGSPVTFTASPVNGGTAPTYQWKVNGANVAGATASTFTTSTLNNSDVVTVALTSNASCATTPTATSNAVTVTITSAAAPSVSITPTTVTSCAGSSVTFTASPVNGGSAPTYQWKVNGTDVAGATGSNFTSSTLNNSDVVTVVLTSNSTCATTPTATSNAVTVTVQNITPIRKDTSLNGCSSVVFNNITYTASTVIRDTVKTAFGCDSIYHLTNIQVALPAITRTDSLNGCTSVVFKGITYTSAATIKDTIKTSFGCDSVFRTTIITIAPFVLNITATPNPVTYGSVVNFVTTSTSSYNVITWQPVAIFPNQTAVQQTIIANSSFTANVIARSSSGCLDTASVSVEVIIPNDFFVPNAFTPNNDGNNDYFKPFGSGIRSADIMIFNQFGEMIYHSSNASGWNGTYNGKQQPVGVYSYVIKASFVNGTVIDKKGLFNLIR